MKRRGSSLCSRLSSIIALVAAAGAAGLSAGACSHTRSAGDQSAAEARPAETRGHTAPPSDKTTPAHPRRAAAEGSEGAGGGAHAQPPADRETAPLATSPAGLLEPGAVKSIQQKLSERGFLADDHVTGEMDGATQEAVRKLQRASGLPATGAVDTATAGKLGLPVDRVFKSASVPND